MKHNSLIYLLSFSAFIVGCDSSSKKTSSQPNNQYCYMYPSASGCSPYTAGGVAGGGVGGVGGTGGMIGNNPYPYYPSFYADKNWQVKYPYVPAINCSTPQTPSGITYTPYDTRKGTVTVVGSGFDNPADSKGWYDPNTYVTISGDKTSEKLRTLTGAKQFFWTDSALKVRFKANLQPDSSNANPICYGRRSSQAWLKGYTKIKFDVILVGTRSNGSTAEESLGEQTIDVNNCSTPLDLSNYNGVNYPSKYPEGIYLKIKNVRGNQNWSPGTQAEQQAWDTWGFYPNQYYNGNSYMKAIRSNDCWSVDVEVAADGTKTF